MCCIESRKLFLLTKQVHCRPNDCGGLFFWSYELKPSSGPDSEAWPAFSLVFGSTSLSGKILILNPFKVPHSHSINTLGPGSTHSDPPGIDGATSNHRRPIPPPPTHAVVDLELLNPRATSWTICLSVTIADPLSSWSPTPPKRGARF